MIEEIETTSHIIVNSKDLKKIIKILRLKTVKLCTQSLYKKIIDDLKTKNNKKFLFIIKKTPKVFEQHWAEIYVDGSFKNKLYNKMLEESSILITEHYDFLSKLESLADLSEDGKVYLNKHDASIYNDLKNMVSNYNHNDIESVNDLVFDNIVKMIYNRSKNI